MMFLLAFELVTYKELLVFKIRLDPVHNYLVWVYVLTNFSTLLLTSSFLLPTKCKQTAISWCHKVIHNQTCCLLAKSSVSPSKECEQWTILSVIPGVHGPHRRAPLPAVGSPSSHGKWQLFCCLSATTVADSVRTAAGSRPSTQPGP